MRNLNGRIANLESQLKDRRPAHPPRFTGIVIELPGEDGQPAEIEEYDMNFHLIRRYSPDEPIERTT
jgi:hypothetical protein